MGLDMYLHKKTYVQNWKHLSKDEIHSIVITKGGKPTNIKPERISYIIETVATWRKFNALHAWFVENVQDGNDNCSEYYVNDEKLVELLDLLTRIDADNSLASELLPTASGFFFGGKEYDEWYFKDVKDTITILEELIKEGNGDYYYNSSW